MNYERGMMNSAFTTQRPALLLLFLALLPLAPQRLDLTVDQRGGFRLAELDRARAVRRDLSAVAGALDRLERIRHCGQIEFQVVFDWPQDLVLRHDSPHCQLSVVSCPSLRTVWCRVQETTDDGPWTKDGPVYALPLIQA